MTPTLSILICSLPSRLKKFSIIEELTKQAKGKPVEILYLGDNKRMTVGEKRNHLVRMAKGDYVCFVDDDDRVTPDYVDAILSGIESGKDVICFRAEVRLNGGHPKRCLYSLRAEHGEDSKFYYRKPNHLMVWDRILPLTFQNISNGEDTEWAERMAQNPLWTEHVIPKVLYYYDFDSNGTEAQG